MSNTEQPTSKFITLRPGTFVIKQKTPTWLQATTHGTPASTRRKVDIHSVKISLHGNPRDRRNVADEQRFEKWAEKAEGRSHIAWKGLYGEATVIGDDGKSRRMCIFAPKDSRNVHCEMELNPDVPEFPHSTRGKWSIAGVLTLTDEEHTRVFDRGQLYEPNPYRPYEFFADIDVSTAHLGDKYRDKIIGSTTDTSFKMYGGFAMNQLPDGTDMGFRSDSNHQELVFPGFTGQGKTRNFPSDLITMHPIGTENINRLGEEGPEPVIPRLARQLLETLESIESIDCD